MMNIERWNIGQRDLILSFDAFCWIVPTFVISHQASVISVLPPSAANAPPWSFGLADPERLRDRLQEEVFTPHNRLVHAELLVEMVHAVHEHALPARRVPGEIAVGAERIENRERSAPVPAGAGGVGRQVGEVPEAR